MKSDKCKTCGICCCVISLGRDDNPNNPELEFINNPENEELIIKDFNGNLTLGPRENCLRCSFLKGILGKKVACSLYNKNRPKICNDYPKDERDIGLCNKLREKYCLGPVTMGDFFD